MADLKTTELDALAVRDDADLIMVVDTSDTSMAASGTNKYMTTANFLDGVCAPGGSDSQIQFNSGDTTFGGDIDLTWKVTDHLLTIGGTGNSGSILVMGTYNSGWTIPNATGTRMFFNPRKTAFRAGATSSAQWNAVNVGAYSTAFGYDTTASGEFSTAFGYDTTASGDFSTAFGYNTTASGEFSTAFGVSTTASTYASTAFGVSTTASGDFSTAFGYNTTASGEFSTAFGYNTTASGFISTAFGRDTTASGDYSTAFGYYTTASGDYSIATGSYSQAYRNGQNAFAMGCFAAAGDAQSSKYIVRQETTSTDKAALLNTAPTNYPILLLENRTYTFSILITARDGDTPKSAGYKIEGVCSNDSGVGSIIGSTVIQLSGANTLGTVEVDIDSAGAEVYLIIYTTPNTTNTVRWVASVNMVEVENDGGYY